MKIAIYILKDPTNNKIKYVGQTVNPKNRLNRHISNSNANTDNRHISNWIRSLNQSPIMEIIEWCDYEERNEKENYYINLYNENNDLCNSSNGGTGAGIGNKNCLGRIISIETKTKISKANKGQKYNIKSGNKGKKVYQYTINKELICIYNSIKEAVKNTGLNRVTIRRNIQGVSKSKKFIWTDKPLII